MAVFLTVLEIIFLIMVLIILAFWIYIEFPIRKIKKITYEIPGPKRLAIFGTFQDMLYEGNGILIYFLKCVAEYGPVVRLPQIGRLIVLVSSVEDIEILLKDTENIYKPQIMMRLIKPWMGDGLLFSSGSYWKQQRKLITPTFHFNVLEKFFEVFNEQGDVLIKILTENADGKTNLNIFPFMQAFALDIIYETAMGIKMHSQTKLIQSDYVAAVYELQRIFVERLYKPLEQIDLIFSFTKNGRIQKRALKILKEKTDEIIQQRRDGLIHQFIESNVSNDVNCPGSKNRLAFLDLLLQAKNPDGTPLTNQQIRDEVASFTFAGHDTTSTQLSFFYYILSKHPNIQEEIYKEQCTILMDDKCEPTFQDIQKMQYLERTIKEAQRFCTIVPYIIREMNKTVKLKTNGYIIPKDTMVIMFTPPLHKNPNIYPNPEKFDPDRFLPENVRQRNTFAFLPFGAGSRNCLGQKFAMLEMKIITSKIIRSFKILPAYEADGTPYEPKLRSYIVLTALNGIKIRLVPRK